MKRLLIALVAAMAVAMTADLSYAQGRGSGGSGRSGGGGYAGGGGHSGGGAGGGWHSGGGSGHSGGGGYSHGSGGYGGHGGSRGGYYGGHYGGHGGYYGGHYGGYYGWGVGLYLGGPWYWGWPYYAGAYPYYPYGTYPVYESPPTIYVEPEPPADRSAASVPAPMNFWYYCTNPAGYFPYVQNCNEPWMKVVPPPPSPATPSGRIAPGPVNPAWQTDPASPPAN
jgi:hypothetical protein